MKNKVIFQKKIFKKISALKKMEVVDENHLPDSDFNFFDSLIIAAAALVGNYRLV